MPRCKKDGAQSDFEAEVNGGAAKELPRDETNENTGGNDAKEGEGDEYSVAFFRRRHGDKRGHARDVNRLHAFRQGFAVLGRGSTANGNGRRAGSADFEGALLRDSSISVVGGRRLHPIITL